MGQTWSWAMESGVGSRGDKQNRKKVKSRGKCG